MLMIKSVSQPYICQEESIFLGHDDSWSFQGSPFSGLTGCSAQAYHVAACIGTACGCLTCLFPPRQLRESKRRSTGLPLMVCQSMDTIDPLKRLHGWFCQVNQTQTPGLRVKGAVVSSH